jgi:hypothetical protein
MILIELYRNVVRLSRQLIHDPQEFGTGILQDQMRLEAMKAGQDEGAYARLQEQLRIKMALISQLSGF